MVDEREKEHKGTPERVQEAWDRAIEDFAEIDGWDGFVGWCGKYAPRLFRRADRYQRMGLRDAYLVDRLVKAAFWEYRQQYLESFDANLGIAMAPNSQAFEFSEVARHLCASE